MTRAPPKIRIGVTDYNEKKKNNVDETAVFSTLSEKKKTVMRRSTEEISAMCFIYNVGVRSLVEKHNICVQGDQSGKEDLDSLKLHPNVSSDQNYNNV